MKKEFKTKDSGKRVKFAGGMMRDTSEGKPDFTLIWYPFLVRLAELLGRGVEKYGRDNWKNAKNYKTRTIHSRYYYQPNNKS